VVQDCSNVLAGEISSETIKQKEHAQTYLTASDGVGGVGWGVETPYEYSEALGEDFLSSNLSVPLPLSFSLSLSSDHAEDAEQQKGDTNKTTRALNLIASAEAHGLYAEEDGRISPADPVLQSCAGATAAEAAVPRDSIPLETAQTAQLHLKHDERCGAADVVGPAVEAAATGTRILETLAAQESLSRTPSTGSTGAGNKARRGGKGKGGKRAGKGRK